jgi:hypothetical protein
MITLEHINWCEKGFLFELFDAQALEIGFGIKKINHFARLMGKNVV